MSNPNINQPLIVANVHNLVTGTLENAICFYDIMENINNFYFSFMTSFNFDFTYSQPVWAFIRSTSAIVGSEYPEDVFWNYDRTRSFIDILSFYKSDIEYENQAFIYQESQNKRELERYISSLINHYSRLLFVRIDLKYALATSHHVSIEDFDCHMQNLRDLIGNKKTCFKNLQGYAWALEQGSIEGGLHCHLLLMYDGSKRQNDWHLAKEVGEKWQDITDGLGEYYSYHDKEVKQRYSQYDNLGIGMIHRNNPTQVENALRTALYLTKPEKTDQHLKLKVPGMRTFGHGQYRIAKRRGLRL
ncbi:YagK/YfjJ domain-containing protein [Psychrobacter sp. bablab_jr012]|uniref:YagK/YfjJ domain-containing protein n=1 Tax=Psychrobacter sp. bablab_jr012 TaxID=2755061 RepID=UPI0018F496F3|nr:inovirus-type Gp2 protein [Psychrobacter sp. bablab_jr012]